MKNLSYYLVLIYILILNGSTAGQSGSITPLRDVIVITGDTVVKATVLSTSQKLKYDKTKWYYWYGKGHISSNLGGAGGKLLHGNYRSFTDGRLVVSGTFYSGLKDGIWTTWDNDGALISQQTWRQGKVVAARSKGGAIHHGGRNRQRKENNQNA